MVLSQYLQEAFISSRTISVPPMLSVYHFKFLKWELSYHRSFQA